MQRARFWILCAMGALVVISGILLFGARYWAVNAKALKNMLPAEVDMRLDNLTLTEAGAENRSMVINADSAQYFKTRDLFVLETVRARIITDQGNYDIEADTGNYNQEQKVIDLAGNIRVADDEGGVLTTTTLTLKFTEGLLISENEFCYATPQSSLDGKSFVFQTREKLLKVEGRTHFFYQ